LPHNDVIVNQSHGTLDRRQKFN